jgi:hypothetical protein
VFDTLGLEGTWHDLDVGRPIAAPLERCPELLGVDLATVCKLAAEVEPYIRADATGIWSLMQLERQLRPEAYGRRRGGLQALVVPRVGECSIALRYPLMWGSVEANTSSTSAEPTW